MFLISFAIKRVKRHNLTAESCLQLSWGWGVRDSVYGQELKTMAPLADHYK